MISKTPSVNVAVIVASANLLMTLSIESEVEILIKVTQINKLFQGCKNLTSEILPNFKKRQSYPVESSLELCLKHHFVDGAVYLYKSTGALKDAYEFLKTICKNVHFGYDSKIIEEIYK